MPKRIISWLDENPKVEDGNQTYNGEMNDHHALNYMTNLLKKGMKNIELYELVPTKQIEAEIKLL